MDNLETIAWWWVAIVGAFLIGLAITVWIIIKAIIGKIDIKEAADQFWARWRKP